MLPSTILRRLIAVIVVNIIMLEILSRDLTLWEGDATKTRHVIAPKAIKVIKKSLPVPENCHLEGDIVIRIWWFENAPRLRSWKI